MNIAGRSIRYLLCLMVVLMFTAAASAQFNAAIQGTVTDQSGAVVPNATVTVTNQATGVARTTVSSGAGFFRVAGLAPGTYTVTTDAATFQKTTTKEVAVDAETIRPLNITLKPGGAQETVNVSGEVPAMQTETATISDGITERQVQELPQVGRDPYELIRLAPGVFGDGARNGSGQAMLLPNGAGPGGSNNSIFQTENVPQITANGQRVSGNNFLIDGVDVNSQTWGGAAVVTPNQESVAEIKVVSSSYSAEDGRNSGAQIKVISKSGSNALHGSGFFKYDEPGLNAYNKFGGWTNGYDHAPDQRVNTKMRQFGGSIGGPVVKDKLFFFFSYEGERRSDQTYNIGYVETEQFRQALIAQGGTSGLILSQPGAAPRVVKYLGGSCADIVDWNSGANSGICQPVSGGLDLGSPVPITNPADPYVPFAGGMGVGGTYLGSGLDGTPDVVQALLLNPAYHNGAQYNARVDYHMGNHQFAASTYITTADTLSNANQQYRPMADVRNKPINPAGTLIWNWTASPTLLNEARFNISRFHFDEIGSNPNVNFGVPETQIEGLLASGARLDYGVPRGNNTPGLLTENTFAFRDTVTKVVGKYAFKFGAEIRREQNNNNEIGLARPVFSSVRLWNFYNSAPIYEGIDWNPQTGAPDSSQRYMRSGDYGLFAQTDWKVRPNLTLNFGLRWEYYSPISEKEGRLTNLVLGPNGLVDPTIKVTDQLYPPDRNNFAPRIGFAWSPSALNNKAVLRGGVGLYYNRFEGAAFGPMRENPPFHASWGFCCGTSSQDWSQPYMNGAISYVIGTSNSPLSFPANTHLATGIDPTTNFPLGCSTLGVLCQVQVYATPPEMPNPYSLLYSLETEYQLPARMDLTLGYQGSFSRKQLRIYNLNQVHDEASPYAQPVYYIQPDVNGNYNAMNVTLTRSFSQGVQFDAKYRWAKSMDQSSFGAPNAAANETFPRDLRSEYGPSDYDVTHYFVASAIWDLPVFRHRNDLVGKALGGWRITSIFTARSGFPWTPVTNNACYQTPGNQYICPSRPVAYYGGAGTNYGNDTFLTPGGNFPGGGSTYFDNSTRGVPGIGRNSFRGPHYQTVDMTLGKEIPLPFLFKETSKLDVRANFFNIFNKLNLAPFGFNTSSTQVENQYFGMATNGLAGRVVELQARFTF